MTSNRPANTDRYLQTNQQRRHGCNYTAKLFLYRIINLTDKHRLSLPDALRRLSGLLWISVPTASVERYMDPA